MGFDDELYVVVRVILLKKRSNILFEIMVHTFARAENKNGIAALRSKPEGSNVSAGADTIGKAKYTLN